MYNVLEEVTKEKYTIIKDIEKIMMENNAIRGNDEWKWTYSFWTI